MKKLKNKLTMILFFSLIWCILNEQFDLSTILSGVIVSIITFFVLMLIQPNKNINYSYYVSIIRLVIFFFVLIKEIYKSAFMSIKHILKNEINPQFVTTSTKIKEPWLQSIIGNAITLTPGTVTVHMSDGEYTILWLYPKKTGYNQIKRYLIDDFENVLIKEENNA